MKALNAAKTKLEKEEAEKKIKIAKDQIKKAEQEATAIRQLEEERIAAKKAADELYILEQQSLIDEQERQKEQESQERQKEQESQERQERQEQERQAQERKEQEKEQAEQAAKEKILNYAKTYKYNFIDDIPFAINEDIGIEYNKILLNCVKEYYDKKIETPINTSQLKIYDTNGCTNNKVFLNKNFLFFENYHASTIRNFLSSSEDFIKLNPKNMVWFNSKIFCDQLICGIKGTNNEHFSIVSFNENGDAIFDDLKYKNFIARPIYYIFGPNTFKGAFLKKDSDGKYDKTEFYKKNEPNCGIVLRDMLLMLKKIEKEKHTDLNDINMVKIKDDSGVYNPFYGVWATMACTLIQDKNYVSTITGHIGIIKYPEDAYGKLYDYYLPEFLSINDITIEANTYTTMDEMYKKKREQNPFFRKRYFLPTDNYDYPDEEKILNNY